MSKCFRKYCKWKHFFAALEIWYKQIAVDYCSLVREILAIHIFIGKRINFFHFKTNWRRKNPKTFSFVFRKTFLTHYEPCGSKVYQFSENNFYFKPIF